MSKLLLGYDLDSEPIYLSKHSWDCGWYWGFGYLGNKDCHYHFDSLLDGHHFKIEEVFSSTKLTQNNWWQLLELFKQTYNLQEAYETYYRGGAHITTCRKMGISKNTRRAAAISKDMKKILDDIWKYLEEVLA